VVTQSVCYRLLTDRVSRQGPAIGRVRPFRMYPFNQLVFDFFAMTAVRQKLQIKALDQRQYIRLGPVRSTTAS